MSLIEKINTYLKEFAKWESQFPGPIPDSVMFSGTKHNGHVTFGSIIHGNEVGSLPGILKVIEKLACRDITYGGTVVFFLGNKKAALQNVRATDADLNRSFGVNGKENGSYERARAKEIMQVLQKSHVFFDFHQTNKPSLWPFYIFSMHKESYYWAQAAGVAPAFVTRKPGNSFSAAGMCSDEFMRELNRVGVTLELGEKGFHSLANKTTELVTLRTLKNMDKVFSKTTTIEQLAKKNQVFQFYQTTFKEPFEGAPKKLNDGYCNFQAIQKDEILGVDEKGNPLIAPKSGMMLFPKYPVINDKGIPVMPAPGELYVLAEKLPFHPLKWC